MSKYLINFLLITFSITIISCSNRPKEVDFNNLKQVAEIQAKILIALENDIEPIKVLRTYGLDNHTGLKAFGEATRKFGIVSAFQDTVKKIYEKMKNENKDILKR